MTAQRILLANTEPVAQSVVAVLVKREAFPGQHR